MKRLIPKADWGLKLAQGLLELLGTRKIIDVNPANITELPNGEFRFIDAFPEGFKTGGKVNLLKCKI